MYRPNDWEEIKVGDAQIKYLGIVERRAVEAGADAILKSLVKNGWLEETDMVDKDPEEEECYQS